MSAPSGRRPPYCHRDLERLINPRSIALIGASPRPGSFGANTLRNLAGFAGRILPINPNYKELGDRPCYASIPELPEVPDCAVVMVAREQVEGAVEACAAHGVGGVIVYASGYAETAKPERIAQQARLTAIASRSGMRIVGPNSMGVLNYASGALCTFNSDVAPCEVGPFAIGVVSQSGALGYSHVQAMAHGTSFSHLITSGNGCDVDPADGVAYLAGDPSCRVIVCIFEGLHDPQRLFEAGELAWRNDKPVLLFKLATGELGAEAALSHSGALAGSSAAWKAAAERAGMIWVDQHEALVEAASFFAKAPRAKAGGVAVITSSGGSGIMLTDRAEVHSVPTPQPGPATREVLRKHVPDFGAARNPCDVTAQVIAHPESFEACAAALLADPGYAALVMPYIKGTAVGAAGLRRVGEAAQREGKPFCVVWISNHWEASVSVEAEREPNVVLMRSPDRCFWALDQWQKREARRRDAEDPSARMAARIAPPEAAARGAALIDAAGERLLTEREAKRVLASYGVPVIDEALAQSEEEALAEANRLGLPVALKVDSPDLPHKTEAGVIRLNLKTAEDVRAAYRAVLANAAALKPAPRVRGVLVQPMVPPGIEMMIGARIDPLFGPLIVAGLGGIFVELLEDIAIDLAPVTPAQAKAMLKRLKGYTMLRGFRGAEPVDLDGLAGIICRLGELAADQRDRIRELDVNPLICAGARFVAVDALIAAKAEIRPQGEARAETWSHQEESSS